MDKNSIFNSEEQKIILRNVFDFKQCFEFPELKSAICTISRKGYFAFVFKREVEFEFSIFRSDSQMFNIPIIERKHRIGNRFYTLLGGEGLIIFTYSDVFVNDETILKCFTEISEILANVEKIQKQ